MTLKLFTAGVMLACLPFLANGQEKTKTNDYRGKTKTKSMPTWGPVHHYTGDKAVYFPDYYTFYEPDRGYMYWNNGTWTTTTTVPTYMSKADLNKARIEILEETTVQPQTEYRVYREKYPARKVDVVVPVPDVR